MHEVLLRAQVPFRCLDRCVPKEQLDLLQFAAGGPAELRGSPSAIMRRDARDASSRRVWPEHLPDVLDWGNVPAGSLATLYLPGLNVRQILDWAISLYGSTRFKAVDDHTLQCNAEGVSYLPVPPGKGTNYNYVGLLNLDLPAGVKKGQVFKLVVRQVTNAAGSLPPVIEIGAVATSASANNPIFRWRRVIGSFQVTIPVTTADEMLDSEKRLLSNLRWIQRAIPTGDRWFPAFDCYVGAIADRVDALGGDSKKVVASPSGEDVTLLLNILDNTRDFFGEPVDIDIKHRTLASVPRLVLRRVTATRVLPIKNLRRFPQSDYIVTVTPSDWFHPEGQFVTIPPSGTASLTFVFKHRMP